MEGAEEQMLLFVFDEVIIIFRIPTDQYSFLLKSDVRCTYWWWWIHVNSWK